MVLLVLVPVLDSVKDMSAESLLARAILTALALITFLRVSFTEELQAYYIYLVLQSLLILVLLLHLDGEVVLQLLLLLFFLVQISTYEPFPMNLILSLIVSGMGMIVYAGYYYLMAVPARISIVLLCRLFLPAIFMSFSGAFLTKYRELALDLGGEVEFLKISVVKLTRANSVYQDYAVTVTEEAAEKERQRITRDIHDIVGYTLTNTMMLMEAAQDIMQENALALPKIIETARENSQEGLAQIRGALYELRLNEANYPVGIQAITRLVKLFEAATQVEVQCNYGNLPLTVSEKVDSILYHMVQESLVNSFRHGRANKVSIVFWLQEGVIRASITDNGRGATEMIEGIGLKGMKERIGGIGGSVTVSSTLNGFTVRAEIPIGKEQL